MKTESVTIWLVVVTLFLCPCPASGTIYFNDGLTHDINYEINDDVIVDYQAPTMQTTVNLLDGGMIDGCLAGLGKSHITVSGGTITWFLGATDNALVTMTGGVVEQDLYTWLYSKAIVTGGRIDGEIYCKDDSQVTISGGLTDMIFIGQIDTNILISHALFITMGTNFFINGQDADYGYISWDNLPAYTDWRGKTYHGGQLTGTLSNGDFINANILIYGEEAKLLLIPEPATILLFGVGAVILRRKQ